jgi:excisionase family DNA binding protein
MRTPPTKFVPTVEAATRLHVAQLTVRRWVDKGRLRGQRVGRSIIVEEASVVTLEHLSQDLVSR